MKGVFLTAGFILFFISALTGLKQDLYAVTIEADDNLSQIKISKSVEYLADKDGTLGIDDVRREKYKNSWKESDEKGLGFGFTTTAYWVRFNIKNTTDKELDLFLEQAYPLIDDLRLYLFENNRRREYITGDRFPYKYRFYNHRNFIFPLNIKPGSSISLYIREYSTSSLNFILNLYSPEEFNKSVTWEYRLLVMFIGIIIIMIIYNLLIFIFLRRIEYLYYVLFISSYLCIMVSANGMAFQYLWPDSPWWNSHSIPLFNVLLQVSMWLFSTELVGLRKTPEEKHAGKRIYKFLFYLLALSVAINFACILSGIHQATAISLFSMGIIIFFIFLLGVVLIILERNRTAIFGIIAGTAFFLGALSYILRGFSVLPSNIFTEWSIYIGSVLMVVIFSYALADRINSMSRRIREAEKNYSLLVESSDDIIFALDENLNFLSVNRAVGKHLGYMGRDVLGKNFLDFIYEEELQGRRISREILHGYIDELKNNKESISFRTDLKTRYTNEPREFSIKLEYSETSGRQERFLGKASFFNEDVLLKYMKLERYIFEADNYLSNAELLSQRLTRNLNRVLPQNEISLIRTSIREILINAIEHGNLNIKFEEKTSAISSGNYLNFIQARQEDPRYRDKKIYLDYIITVDKAIYSISDEGEGFDHVKMLARIDKIAAESTLTHGRGLLIVKSIFDRVVFNDCGNSVVLVKEFNQ